jgi:hypothetical protein
VTTLQLVPVKVVDDLKGFVLQAMCPFCHYDNQVFTVLTATPGGGVDVKNVEIDTCPHFSSVDPAQNMVFENDGFGIKEMSA